MCLHLRQGTGLSCYIMGASMSTRTFCDLKYIVHRIVVCIHRNLCPVQYNMEDKNNFNLHNVLVLHDTGLENN